MKIDNISNQNFKAFKFSESALELIQRRYKNSNEGFTHNELVRTQLHNPVDVVFDVNKKGTALTAKVSAYTENFQYSKVFKEGFLSKYVSPLNFIIKITNIANKIRLKFENSTSFNKALSNFNRSKGSFKL